MPPKQEAAIAKSSINYGLTLMQCPECKSTHINKNGKKKGKQNYICVNCHRQFIDDYQLHRGYPDEVRRECLTMYVNGMGFRAIERVKGIHHTTIINWVKQVGELLPNAYNPEQIPEVGELDELETFLGFKKRCDPADFQSARERAPRQNKIWIWTAVDHFRQGIKGLGTRRP